MSGKQDRQRLAGTERPAKHSKLGGTWTLLAVGTVLLVLLLVFILMNTHHVQVDLYGAHVSAPLGTALVLAAALGILLVLVPGGGRILQLRRATKQLHREREHFAGRLDEVAEATSPGDQPGTRSPAEQAPAERSDAGTAAAPGEPEAPRAPEETSGRKHHWWNPRD
jgi:uncharacterized integral membrane protein